MNLINQPLKLPHPKLPSLEEDILDPRFKAIFEVCKPIPINDELELKRVTIGENFIKYTDKVIDNEVFVNVHEDASNVGSHYSMFERLIRNKHEGKVVTFQQKFDHTLKIKGLKMSTPTKQEILEEDVFDPRLKVFYKECTPVPINDKLKSETSERFNCVTRIEDLKSK
jgi:hypothetical protein